MDRFGPMGYRGRRRLEEALRLGQITPLEDAGGSRASLRLTQGDMVSRLPMTAASQSVTRFVSRGRSAFSGLGPMLRRWERFVIVLAVCLPVPALAATGLSIPLPATVERLAAALVPWANAADLGTEESLTVGADGAIVLARYELAETERPTALAQTIAAASRTATSGRNRPEKDDGGKNGGTKPGGGSDDKSPASGGGGSGSGGSGGGDPGGSSGGGDPGGSSGPVETIIDETGSATEPVVDVVEDTVDDPVGTVGDVVEDVGGAAGGLLPGAGP